MDAGWGILGTQVRDKGTVQEEAMNNPLAIFIAVWMTGFFGLSWALLVGHWLGFETFSYDQYIIGELLPLAYGGAILSVLFATAIIAAKLHYR